MTTEPLHSRLAEADRFLPCDGLSLLGEQPGSGYTGRRFLVGRSDGQVVQLPLLLYLVMAAVAEGGVDGGWNADQVSARVAAASGQRLTADNVRYLIDGRLAPLGLIAAGRDERPDGPPGAAQPRRADVPPPRSILRPRLRLRLRLRRRHWAFAIGGTAVLVSAAAAAPIMAGTGDREAGGPPSASASAAAAATRSQAAGWVAQQVSPDVAVSCDPGMCRQLRLDGFPAGRLKPLPGSAHGPLPSGVVVATPGIRSQLGNRLAAADAPQVIASFGSGAARVDVRLVAPSGAAAFRTQLTAEQSVLASVGRQLLGNQHIQASPSARAALRAGQVDARLLALLSMLSGEMPVRLTGFAGAPGADPGTPLRAAEINTASPAARSAMVALLNAQRSPYRPVVTTADGGSHFVVTLRFDAPAALNLAQP